MKLKYYLRGAGIGVIIATLVFSIAYAFYKPTMSDEEIIKEATKLGMVSQTDEKDTATDKKSKSDTKEETGADKGTKTKGESENETTKTELLTFSVNAGDTSSMVAGRLKDMGLVEDSDAFDKYLSEQNLDNFILPGEYTIPKGSSFEDIAAILTSKKN